MSTRRDSTSPPPSRFQALRGDVPLQQVGIRKRPSRFDQTASPLSKRHRSSPPHSPTRSVAPSRPPLHPQKSLPPNEQRFVWKKKVDKQRKQGGAPTDESETARIQALQDELVESQRQRARRDAERAEWEAEASREARQLELERNSEARRADAAFVGQQHFARQAIRLRQHRPTRADVFARIVRLDVYIPEAGGDSSDAYTYIDDIVQIARGIAYDDLRDVLEAVEEELDYIPDFPTGDDNNVFNRACRLKFWQGVRTVLTDRQQAGKSGTSLQGVHAVVRPDLEKILETASSEKLRLLESHIADGLQSNGDGSQDSPFGEVDFWTAALKRIRSLLAEDRLKQIVVSLQSERKKRAKSLAASEGTGNRRESRNGESNAEQREADMVRAEAAKGMEENEEMFADEVKVNKPDQRTDRGAGKQRAGGRHGWNDKYRPRKPRYFNRVHTGYNWSAYNRTHYDHDNPPPKTVQGYKFNIFYPDLIDASQTPSYEIAKTENPDVSIITFKAGPPYEDIAFKIVNRPWEKSHKRGFRCSYDRGVLQLWFLFQRYRYRR